MQIEASEALDLSKESLATKAMYGIGEDKTDSYGRRCLIARRLVERGVRFVQLFIDGQIWDNHTSLKSGLRGACERTDKPTAALLTDLRQRGLLDEVVVAWGGEMGRLPIAQLDGKKNEANSGRDHNKNAMVTWMAGPGLKRGYTHGVHGRDWPESGGKNRERAGMACDVATFTWSRLFSPVCQAERVG